MAAARSIPLWARLLAAAAVPAVLVAGLWFFSGVVAPGYVTAIGAGVAWFVVASVLLGRLGKARPQLRWFLRAPFLACAAVAIGGFYWTSVRETTVNEPLDTGVPASKAPAAPGAPDPLAPQR